MNNSRKIWYVVVDGKGLKNYTYVENKKSAEQLKKNIDKIFNTNKIITWIDFIWKSDKEKYSDSQLHGRDWEESKTLIKDIKYYLNNFAV